MKRFFKRDALCLSLLAALLLVCVEVQTWAMTLSFVLILLRFGAEQSWWRTPPSIWANILSVIALALIVFQFRTFMGQEASSAFLVILTSVRILDYKTDRDTKLLTLLGFVLISLKFLYSLDLYWIPVGIMIYLGLWRSLLPKEITHPWRMTTKVALQSFPVVLILFLAFPRVQVPWVRSYSQPIDMVGFSESISPGQIASLARSRETVMRVEFNVFKPRIMDMYWRGAVLEETSGFAWRRISDPNPKNISISSSNIGHDYTITLEPHQMKALPVWEHTRMISAFNLQAHKTDRSTFRAANPIQNRIRYQGVSTETWTGPELDGVLDLPQLPPKTTAWLKEKKALDLDHKGKLKALRDFFTENNFVYTISPGTHEDLDDFLFNRRQGFCEHFAGAYAILARGLGVPSRVITGYQGGEWNTAGDFVRVTQADAHAWAEVRDPKGFWRRVDPTMWIAPLRLELGGVAFFQLSPAEIKLSAFQALERLKSRNKIAMVWDTLQSQVETLNFLWTRTMLEFDLSEQQKLLEYFAPQLGWWLVILVLLFVLYQIFRKWTAFYKNRVGHASYHFRWLERRLEPLGFIRQAHQPPVDFLQSIIQSRPQDKELIQKTIQLYRFERYKERTSGPDDWRRLKREWKRRLRQSILSGKLGSR